MADPTNETKTLIILSTADDFAEARRRALHATVTAIHFATLLGNDAAVWDLQAARRRLEKTDG